MKGSDRTSPVPRRHHVMNKGIGCIALIILDVEVSN